MQTRLRWVIAMSVAGSAAVLAGCGQPCEAIQPRVEKVCHANDAGRLEPGQPFFLDVETTAYGATSAGCAVVIDGGLIAFSLSATVCQMNNGNNPVVPPPAIARCAVPALDAGTYAIVTRTQTTSLVIGPGDSGVTGCP